MFLQCFFAHPRAEVRFYNVFLCIRGLFFEFCFIVLVCGGCFQSFQDRHFESIWRARRCTLINNTTIVRVGLEFWPCGRRSLRGGRQEPPQESNGSAFSDGLAGRRGILGGPDRRP